MNKFLQVILSLPLFLVLVFELSFLRDTLVSSIKSGLSLSTSTNDTSVSSILISGSYPSTSRNDTFVSNITRDSFTLALNDTSVSNITRGSSLFSDDTSPYWASPSGGIAFGFYKLPCSPNQYTVGIWFVKSSHKTLIWTANHKDLLPVHKLSSISVTKEGKLVLWTEPENKEKPLLPDAAEPLSYANLHDNGNFVLYGSDSQIVWQSFDHPTDTLLGGQKLKLGVDHLISNSREYKLSMDKTDGTVVISNAYDRLHAQISSMPWERPKTLPATLNLDTSGMLYLVNSDGTTGEIIYENKYHQRKLEEVVSNVKMDYVYRATLDSRGYFVLYKERIDGNEESSSTMVLLWASYEWSSLEIFKVCIFVLFFFGLVIFAIEEYKKIDKIEKKNAEKNSCEGDT